MFNAPAASAAPDPCWDPARTPRSHRRSESKTVQSQQPEAGEAVERGRAIRAAASAGAEAMFLLLPRGNALKGKGTMAAEAGR